MQRPAIFTRFWNDGHSRHTNVRSTIAECQGTTNGCATAVFTIALMRVYCGEIHGVGSECGHYLVGGDLLSWGKLFELVSVCWV